MLDYANCDVMRTSYTYKKVKNQDRTAREWAISLFMYPYYDTREVARITIDKINENVYKSGIDRQLRKQQATCSNSGRPLLTELFELVQTGIVSSN